MATARYHDISRYLSVEEARQLYVAGDAAHDFDHVWRVTRLAVQLARAEGADCEIVFLAALLHDAPVGEDTLLSAQAVRRAHHLAAAAYAGDFLQHRGMATERVAAVVHSIEAHRFRDQTIQPQTVEAMCLYDADKLDSIGAIGVARAFAYAGSHDTRLWTVPVAAVPPFTAKPQGADYTPVHEHVYKLQNLLATLYTPTAQRLGAKRHETMVTFFELLDKEMRQIE
ncbi:MAG: HD domain-containing protein [Caldilineaceae bacterium]|nr:HD domain-containing protein [Caldilineaceae bacterium]